MALLIVGKKRERKPQHVAVKARTRHSFNGWRMVAKRHLHRAIATEREGTVHELSDARYVVGPYGNWIRQSM